MQREFNVAAFFGRPRVSYRETITGRGIGTGTFEKRISDVQVSGRATVEILPVRGLPETEACRRSRWMSPA
jgi:translation elongation factor EF-G